MKNIEEIRPNVFRGEYFNIKEWKTLIIDEFEIMENDLVTLADFAKQLQNSTISSASSD